MNRYKIIVEYDGTPFHGWQNQKNLDTVQRRLEKAIIPLTKIPTGIYGAGRTDAGVHALGQVAHFDTEYDLDCFRIQECMNAHLVDVPVSVLLVEKVPTNFDARFSAIERSYIYKILNRRGRPCIDYHRVWHVVTPVDEEKMHSAAQCLVGNHDFSSFRASGCQASSPIKTLNKISVERDGDTITVKTSAKSFLYHQVRNMVGSLFLVGCKKLNKQDFIDIFNAKDRKNAGITAPSCGLYLSHITYLSIVFFTKDVPREFCVALLL